LNVCQIKITDTHQAESDEDSAPESILNNKNCLDWNRELDNSNDCEHKWEADNESDIELDNGIEDHEPPEQ
jgi:hypothetical protein